MAIVKVRPELLVKGDRRHEGWVVPPGRLGEEPLGQL